MTYLRYIFRARAKKMFVYLLDDLGGLTKGSGSVTVTGSVVYEDVSRKSIAVRVAAKQ